MPAANRRRATELLSAIRSAVLAELHERGYQGLTYEGVARRAGTSKPVLYRRFGNRAEMAIDALLASRIDTPPAVFTGPLREDLIALASGLITRVGSDGVEAFRGIIGEVDQDVVARVADRILTQFEEWLDDILTKARDAHELGPAVVPDAVTRAIVALVRNEILFVYGAGQPPQIEALVDEVILPLLRVTTALPGPPEPSLN